MTFLGNARPTGIGSLPHLSTAAAIDAVFACCPDLPYWPQLPRVSRREGMVEQAVGGLPGICLPGLHMEEGHLTISQDERFFLGVEQVFQAYESGDPSVAEIPANYAHGFEPFVATVRQEQPAEAKGQIAGPITVGMAILGEDGNPILYDDVLREVLVKFLHLRVKWEAARLRKAGSAPIIFVDEPFLASFGTPFFNWSIPQVRECLEAVTSGTDLVGSHCCSNTDWSILLGSRIDIVSFDAFSFAQNFLAYREDVAAFFSRGGNIAWGIVPTDPDALGQLDVRTLRERLLELVARIEPLGFRREQVLAQSLITPSCGLGSRDIETATRALELTRDLAAGLRKDFLGIQ
jgi:methionine synthase II (cobalamin-independent)